MMEYTLYVSMVVVSVAAADYIMDLVAWVGYYLSWVLMAVGAVIALPLWLPITLFAVTDRERFIQGVAAGYWFSLCHFLESTTIEAAIRPLGFGGACFFAGMGLLLWAHSRRS